MGWFGTVSAVTLGWLTGSLLAGFMMEKWQQRRGRE